MLTWSNIHLGVEESKHHIISLMMWIPFWFYCFNTWFYFRILYRTLFLFPLVSLLPIFERWGKLGNHLISWKETKTTYMVAWHLTLGKNNLWCSMCSQRVDNFRAKGQVSVNKMFDTGCNFHWPQISRILHVLMYIFTTHGTDENVPR